MSMTDKINKYLGELAPLNVNIFGSSSDTLEVQDYSELKDVKGVRLKPGKWWLRQRGGSNITFQHSDGTWAEVSRMTLRSAISYAEVVWNGNSPI